MANLRVVGVWLIGAVALTGACALATNWLSSSNTPTNNSDIEKLMKRFRDERWPYAPEQMERKLGSDEQNAAYYLETACNDLSATEAEDGKRLNQLFNNTDNPTLYALTAQDISRYDSVLRLAERASQCSFLDFKRDWSQGWGVSLPELSSEKLIGYLLVGRAVIEARAGDADKSLRDLQTVSRLAGLESNDGSQVSFDLAIELGSRVWSTSDLCAALLTSKPVALKAFVGHIKSLHLNADPMPALRAEAYIDYHNAQVLPIVEASTLFDYQARQQFASENLTEPYVESRLRLWTFVGDKLNHRPPGETELAALNRTFDECEAWPGDDGRAAREVDMITKYEDEQRQEQSDTNLVAMVQQNRADILKSRQTLEKLAERTRIALPAPKQPNTQNPVAGPGPDMAGAPPPATGPSGTVMISPNVAPGANANRPAIRGPVLENAAPNPGRRATGFPPSFSLKGRRDQGQSHQRKAALQRKRGSVAPSLPLRQGRAGVGMVNEGKKAP